MFLCSREHSNLAQPLELSLESCSGGVASDRKRSVHAKLSSFL